MLVATEIRFEVGPSAVTVKTSQPGAITLYVDNQTEPILGTQTSGTFTPRFLLTPGVKYRAVWKPTQGPTQTHRFELPRPTTARAKVEQVFPTTHRLPENQLKFYLHFTGPMSRGEAYRHIHLKDSQNKTVELPFLELDEELWDRNARRLTLFFDPGRIKRGLVPHHEAGVPLIKGRAYTLVIDAAWPDAAGQAMAQGFTKAFTVVEADRTAPTLASWKLTLPRPHTKEPVTLDFPEPLDRALLDRMIRVRGTAGTITIEREETRWRFTPNGPWQPGDYEVEVDSILEDLAGNKLNRLFDVDVFDRVDKRVVPETLRLRFTL